MELHTCLVVLGEICLFCFAEREPGSFKQPLMQYSCHKFGILDFQQLVPHLLPGRKVEVKGGWRFRERKREGSCPEKHTFPALAVYITLARLWLFPWRRE